MEEHKERGRVKSVRERDVAQKQKVDGASNGKEKQA